MPIHVRVIATYPADEVDPEERFDITYRLRPDFASTPAEAHTRIVAALQAEEVLSFPADDELLPVRYDSDAVEEVWVW